MVRGFIHSCCGGLYAAVWVPPAHTPRAGTWLFKAASVASDTTQWGDRMRTGCKGATQTCTSSLLTAAVSLSLPLRPAATHPTTLERWLACSRWSALWSLCCSSRSSSSWSDLWKETPTGWATLAHLIHTRAHYFDDWWGFLTPLMSNWHK